MFKRQAGFTLIELVVVIVILGILAAFAVPRFIDLGEEARIAALDGLAGSIRSAAVLAHSVQLANNSSTSTSVTMEGNTVTMLNGYPTATTTGIQLTQNPNPPSGFSITVTAGTSVDFTLDDAPTPASCRVRYEPATTTTPPSVTTTTSGCA